jgi:transcriptional regulator with XRE-family HTH domain/predicted negative regulator of RcsB-dependent stress response
MGRARPTHVPDPKALGTRLRALREARGLSLRQIAFPGCSPSYLSRVESGDRVASLTILAELARRLGTTIEELLGRSIDGRISDGDLAAAEVAARMGAPKADEDIESLLSGARSLGDTRAESRLLEFQGLLALDRRDEARAVELLEQARSTGPAASARERPALFRALGRAYTATGDLIQAASVLQTAFDQVCEAPPDAALMVQFGSYLADAYTDRGRFSDAETVLGRVLRHDRDVESADLVQLDWSLARTYAEQGESRVAEMYAHRVLARMERGEELRARGHAHLLIAGVLLDQGQLDEAAPHLEQAERLFADEAPAELALLAYERGRAALAAGDTAAAGAHAAAMRDRTAESEPGAAGMANALLSEIALAEGRLDDARELCEEGIRQMTDRAAPPHVARAYDTLSRIEEEAGNLEAALEALRNRPAVPTAKP